ncbi:30S ribosomal protein S13 [Candidatus Nomurabacteria bacterium RIFCSPHIGHO2_02_FULL_41_18]|uniref:Small ribosomal subunit protein uS13 n=1 Tax=Candidatus Nomurabacteria bacterium RIFCSPHIGHO2_02_FULL_41_18 TaxID=1801754 RepID=A0A1F6W5E8_9BACT|nr:MAG: 30S ribosomal protein S13 [Candidatus Nomurabacteria bacterium RIFCSPHIGHO2_01_FULL_41_71]OGI77064.1 MAG: 30S ribosomal protein S13 [Candidatus Nomurabacteria bacterium RIFCSPHIGHO2_02_FULL_41_18]OGI90132.1 MAG: 30S ribosomal protein S13 [Candidatus Nomurabacteria bacterium RIFCSPLOWO2_01_FULL_41_52b]OGJ00460.1 MAG: 30S ribosomal protein S13 [Candidatus Nomurabacteria bacterium RIFCSPLOWO2_02_FULL_41_9]
MRISGITIPNEKRLEIGLSALYGIGIPSARRILTQVGISHGKKAKDLNAEEENKIRAIVDGITIEGNLKREVSANIKRLKDIKSYRGIRHMKRLPVHGQRTKTNSRTVRGNVRKTMASGKRKESKT